MRGLIFPLIIIAVAVGIFFLATDPLINNPLAEQTDDTGRTVFNGGIKALNEKKAELTNALVKAGELRQKVEDLERNYNSFSDDQLTRLAKLLPDNVDNVQLIIDTNNIAALHGMRIKGIKVKTEEEKSAKNGGDAATRAKAITRGNIPQQSTITLGFNVSGSYGEFLNFLSDLQQSLRVVDMSSLTFSAADKDFYTYNVELKTYWLK